MKEEKTEIKKIVIEVEGETISLSKEGSVKLHKILDELFGERATPITWPTIIEPYQPYRPWYWGYGTGVYAVNDYRITCQDNTATFSVK